MDGQDAAAGAKRPGRRNRAGEGDDVGPPQRKVVEGGWGFGSDSKGTEAKGEPAPSKSEGGTAKPGRRRGVDAFSTDSEPAENKRRNKHFDDDNDDIMIIPDLEEDEQEDLTTQVAAAPRNTSRRVQSMRELDHEIKYTLPTTMQAGLDLKLLTASLSPPDQVKEEDETWEFDTLLQRVSQEMQVEVDEEEKEKKEMAESTGATSSSNVSGDK